MCDVHLIETGRTIVQVDAQMMKACCYCNERLHGETTKISGKLDDGTPGVFHFLYHPDCADEMEFDTDEQERNDGCFSYGTPTECTEQVAEIFPRL